MTTNTNTIRANRLTVKTLTDGVMQADFYRTHKHITTVISTDTAYQPKADTNKSAIREDFRSYVADNAQLWGVNYDPIDQRTTENLRKASYTTEEEVAEDLTAMITPDIKKFMAKMPHADIITLKSITADSFIPKTHTSKGTSLTTMGIEDGKYVNSGKLAWFDIEVTVTMLVRDTAEIYEIINMELVSGQLKKSRMTQTQWNMDTKQSLADIGIIDEDPKAKAEKSAKAEDPKVRLTIKRKAGDPIDIISLTDDKVIGRDADGMEWTFNRKPEWDTKTLTAYAIPDSDNAHALKLTSKQIEEAKAE